jgi:hypothetical protein
MFDNGIINHRKFIIKYLHLWAVENPRETIVIKARLNSSTQIAYRWTTSLGRLPLLSRLFRISLTLSTIRKMISTMFLVSTRSAEQVRAISSLPVF